MRHSNPVSPGEQGAVTEFFWAHADKMVKVDPFRVTVAGKKEFGCVNMGDFLDALREKLQPNPTVIENHRRMFVPEAEPLRGEQDEPIKAAVLYHDVQVMLKHL